MKKWWDKFTDTQKKIIIALAVISLLSAGGYIAAQIVKRKKKAKFIADLLKKYEGKLTQGLNPTPGGDHEGTVGLLTDKNTNDMSITQGLNPTANDGINNPLNIRQKMGDTPTGIPWLGKISKDNPNFEQFEFMWQGFHAGMKNVLNVSKQTTTRSFNDTIQKLSPPSENNTTGYISRVTGDSGIDGTVDMSTLSPEQFKAMIIAMAHVEQDKPGAPFQINEADVDMAYDSIQPIE